MNKEDLDGDQVSLSILRYSRYQLSKLRSLTMDYNESNIASPNRNIKKAYFIVFVCMIMQAIPFGVAQNIQPLFIPYVTSKFGFSLASFSLIFTFGAIASAICSPFLGKLYGGK